MPEADVDMNLILPGLKEFLNPTKGYIDPPEMLTGLSFNQECLCETPGEDDGRTTCFLHHNCNRGECTHQDGEEDE